MTFITEEDEKELMEDAPVEVVDITAALAKIEKEAKAKRGDLKVLKIGTDKFKLTDELSSTSLSRITGASADNRIDYLIEGISLLVQKEDRKAFVAFIEDNELPMESVQVLAETMLETISGKD